MTLIDADKGMFSLANGDCLQTETSLCYEFANFC